MKKGFEILDSLNSIESLRTIPIAMNKIIQKLTNPDADIEEIADLVLKDPVLTSRVLRIVNSSFIGLPHQLTSLKQAIVLLGLRRIQDIVLTTLLFNQFSLSESSKTLTPTLFWSHSLGCAKGTMLLHAEKENNGNDIYYLAGLVHDLGEIIFAQHFQEEFEKIYSLAKKNGVNLFQQETEMFGITHCDIGARVAEMWNFPPTLIHAIQYHHQPELTQEDVLIVAAVNLSDILSRLMELNYGIEEKLLLSITEEQSYKILADHYSSMMSFDWERFSFELMDQFKLIVSSVYQFFNQNGN